MYIRKTKTRSTSTGEAYYSYRLVTSARINGKVRQKTLLNLGSSFALPEELWPELACRIDQLVSR